MTATLIKASAHETGLPSQSVHTIITNPPYFGLRAYDGEQGIEWPTVEYAPMPGLPTITIPGCAPDCEHEWGDTIEWMDGTLTDNHSGLDGTQTNDKSKSKSNGAYCQKCGGWRGGLGAEPTPEAYIGHMVLVMREMWRVLRDDGTAWINLGDSFAGSGGAGGDYNDGGIRDGQPKFKPPKSALKAKTKMLIPHRFALAMQAEGWIVRNDIVWAKGLSGMKTALQSAYDELIGGDEEMPDYAGSCMPYSGQDNLTPSHEYIFLMTKGPRYYYDNVAVAEVGTNTGNFNGHAKAYGDDRNDNGRQDKTQSSTRNLRSVWVINPGSYPGAHFATFPPRLPEICILAGTSAKGVCPVCGAQWARVVDKQFKPQDDVSEEKGVRGQGNQKPLDDSNGQDGYPRGTTESTTTGWQPTCTCDAGEPVPATVLDPFNGSGTTGMMATTHNRHYIGIDLSDKYFKLTNDRLSGTQPMLPGILA